MNQSRPTLAPLPRAATAPPVAPLPRPSVTTIAMALAAAAIPLSLLWDFSWESTVGVDGVWAPPHALTYVAVALAAVTALVIVLRTRAAGGVRIGPLSAPVGAWLTLWGAVLYAAGFLFDRWWQSAYGLGAGIWHPPQLAKAAAFFAITIGAWLLCLRRSGAGFVVTGGVVLAMISIVTLTSNYPNHQHSASFYLICCATYPIVLTSLAKAGKAPGAATIAAAVYMALFCSMVWLLPLIPASPQAAPVYNSLDHMLPPPFPLLLILPAAAMDVLLRMRWGPWMRAGIAGLVFFIVFAGAQWICAEFLLSGLADNWFFAGAGKHWPFFLKIDASARVQFWGPELNAVSALGSMALAIAAVAAGLCLGTWMERVRR